MILNNTLQNRYRDRERARKGKEGMVKLEKGVGLVFSRDTSRILLDLAIDLFGGGLDDRAVHGDDRLLFIRAFGLGDELFGFEGGDTAGACDVLV